MGDLGIHHRDFALHLEFGDEKFALEGQFGLGGLTLEHEFAFRLHHCEFVFADGPFGKLIGLTLGLIAKALGTASIAVDPAQPEIRLPDNFPLPPGGLNIRWPDNGIGQRMALAQEARVHTHKLDAARAFAGMRERKVLVKNVSTMHPLLARCLRLTVGSDSENARMLDALQASI